MPRSSPLLALLAAAGLAQAACPPPPADAPPERPDWRDQVIYFLMLDRFDDGDARNNDQGAGEYDPADPRRYSGGDFAGACRRLDYVRGLGATAVWITPPVAGQWWDGQVGYGGYHGYWASDFMAVDPHLGGLDDYRAFADALHARGMSLVQDVVVNHTGNFFSYRAGHDAADPAVGYAPNPDARPVPAPTRPPFTLNDPRRPADLAAAIYHWTPVIRDYADAVQERTFTLADLDDLNTENPAVRRALREAYGYWIREVGVDAMRVDTAFYVPPEYFRDFMHADDPAAPGMAEAARRAGIRDFHAFGEGFALDRPFDDTQARKVESYARDAAGPLLPAMINFPLYGSLGDVFARGRPTAELGHRIRATLAVHADPHRMPTFLDNHDVDRFLAAGDEAGLRQGLLALMTLPGIPTLYYGTEQGFRVPRQAMFAGGWGSGGRDHFDADAPLYRYLADVTGLRRGERLYSRGVPTVLRDEAGGAGVLAWRIDHAGAQALVLFNTARGERLLDGLATGLPADRGLEPVFSAQPGHAPALHLAPDGALTVRLPPQAGLVLRPGPVRADRRAAGGGALVIDPLPNGPAAGAIEVSGRAPPGSRPSLLVDGRLDRARPVAVGRDGRWRARLPVDGLVDPDVRHRLVLWDGDRGAVSAARTFRVAPRWHLAGVATDPAGDDRGPAGTYTYPDDPAWRATRPGDLREVRAEVSGGSLRVTLRFENLLHGWNAPNGFDHANATLFLELPGTADGARVMPGQAAHLPGDLRWHRRWRVGGWTSALFAPEGAGAEAEGRAVAPAPRLAVDHANTTITMTLPAEALGDPASLDGARLYVTTWDYDGGYRVLQPVAGPHQFGGGDGNDPRVLDDAMLVLRTAGD